MQPAARAGDTTHIVVWYTLVESSFLSQKFAFVASHTNRPVELRRAQRIVSLVCCSSRDWQTQIESRIVSQKGQQRSPSRFLTLSVIPRSLFVPCLKHVSRKARNQESTKLCFPELDISRVFIYEISQETRPI